MTPGTDENTTIKRRERHTGTLRNRRLYITYTDAELKVVTTAARRDGQMALGAWAGRQLMAVAQETLIPVSRDAGDVLRELIRSRLHLQETVAALHALATPAVPFPVAPGTPSSRPRTAVLPPAPDPVLPDPVHAVLTQALDAIGRVDEATVQVMRERRSRT
ncbi:MULTISPECIES: hypothetical protein [Streptomyces]|uniref:hypothetical protein n=1 Tax=Streptomyces TaxID=1883 RepID=UPI0005B776BD|nr:MULTISPECIES: hypothetical protein [Streptomyces]MDP9947253.1 hypothetical protein [Streptomyces sp. DSM 41269]MDP9954129.1 hypothetical protein [Streptomyces sp. DSM 41269]MDP9954361.1 hypothetical protein [Streptomyces sp. DSM 41269]